MNSTSGQSPRPSVKSLAGPDRLIWFFYLLFFLCYAAVAASALLRGPDKLALVLTGVGVLACLVLLCWLDRLLSRHEAALEHLYPRLLTGFCLCMFLLQMTLALVLRHEQWNDIGAIHQGAIEWVETGSFTSYYYYYLYFPNNLGSMTFLYLCFKGASLLGFTDYYAVGCLVTCVFLVSVMAVTSLICRRLAGVRSAVLILAVYALSVQFWVMGGAAYTDELSMPFPALVFYLYLLAREKTGRDRLPLYLAMGLAAGLGSINKITVLIIVIAILLDVLLRREFRDLLRIGVCTLGLALAMNAALSACIYSGHLDREEAREKNTPLLHWIMMGVKDEGKYNAADYDFTWGITPPEARNPLLLEEIKKRVAEKGPLGMVDLFSTKSAFDFGDGTYGIDDFLSIDPVYDTWVHQIFLSTGRFYRVYRGYATALHLSLMLFMLAGVFPLLRPGASPERRLRLLVPYVALFGLWLFLMCWETCCRYFSNFAPVLITCGVLGVEPFRRTAGKMLSGRKAGGSQGRNKPDSPAKASRPEAG